MQVGTTISTAGHVALLAWGLVSFSAKPFDAVQVEAMPVDIINAQDFSQITSGIKTAPAAPAPKPLVEKVGDAKPVEDVDRKVSEKAEIKSASSEPAPPPPPDVQKKPEEAKKDEKPPDQIVEALKSEAKKEPPKPKPQPPKKPPQPKLDFSKIENKLALLDKREQRRNAATGETINTTPSLGSATGHSSLLTLSYTNALISRLQDCWKPDGGSLREEVRSIPMTITFNPDGTLAAPPQIETPPRNTREQALAEGVVRAVMSCQPFTMLPRTRYEEWRRLQFDFCPIPPADGGCAS